MEARDAAKQQLKAAQAIGDLAGMRKALLEAKTTGADPVQIEQAIAEVEKLEKSAQAAESAARATRADADTGGAAARSAEAARRAAESSDQPAPEAPLSAEEAAERKARAEAHKKRGNDRLKDGSKGAAREAQECFTAGLEERCQDPVLIGQLLGNRAHVRMLLRHFVEAVDDCRKAIEVDPGNLKAYWRGAKASLHQDLFRNGIEFCEAGLRHNSEDGDLVKMKDACVDKLATQQRRKTELAALAPSASSADPGDFNADEAMVVQDKVNDLSEQVQMVAAQIGGKQRERQRTSATEGLIAEMPADTKLYQAVGRSFIRQDREIIEQSLSGNVDRLQKELPGLEKAHEELEKRKVAAEAELKEMVQAFQKSRGAPAA